MAILAEKESYLNESVSQDESEAIPCAVIFSDGEEVKIWKGAYGESNAFEKNALRGRIHLLKFAIGASEVDYWDSKFPLIKKQWQRDAGWRKWTQDRLSMLRKKWIAEQSKGN